MAVGHWIQLVARLPAQHLMRGRKHTPEQIIRKLREADRWRADRRLGSGNKSAAALPGGFNDEWVTPDSPLGRD